MWAKQLKIICLLIAGFVGFASTIIPHHHDEDGAVCLLLSDINHQDQHNEGEQSGPCCDDNRMNTVRVSITDVADLLRVVPVQTSVGSWALAIQSPLSGEPSLSDFGVYIERLHAVAYLQAHSLRAPPVA